MVIKTDLCEFSEMRIYPGNGRRFISKDGKTHYFISQKCRSLYHQKIKPVKLTWTQAWRRFNRKTKVEEIQKRRTRKTTRVQKAIVGLSLEEIKRKRAEDNKTRDANLESQKSEVKKRQQAKVQAKKEEQAKIAKSQKKDQKVASNKMQKGK
jgi:large subunit ribosomal protein L24e